MFLSWSSCWTFLVLVGKDPDVFHHSNSQRRSWNSIQGVQVKPVGKSDRATTLCDFHTVIFYHWIFFSRLLCSQWTLYWRTAWKNILDGWKPLSASVRPKSLHRRTHLWDHKFNLIPEPVLAGWDWTVCQSTRHYTLSTLEMLEIHYTRAYILQKQPLLWSGAL